jgi:hypothetical protein
MKQPVGAAIKISAFRKISLGLAPAEELFFELNLQLIESGIGDLARLRISQIFGDGLNDRKALIFALGSFGNRVRLFDDAGQFCRRFPTGCLQAAAQLCSIRRVFDPPRARSKLVEAIGGFGTGLQLSSIEGQHMHLSQTAFQVARK